MFLVTNRQSASRDNVDRNAERKRRKEAAKAHLGARVRARMEALGLDGESGVKELCERVVAHLPEGASPPRWQTVQFWVQGRSLPREDYQVPLAKALGVTLEELIGVALGHEPNSRGWAAFVASPLGQTMTPEERAVLAAHREPAHGRGYSESYYRTALLSYRAEA